MALLKAKRLLRRDVKLRISNLSEEEKLRQSNIVTDKVRMNVLIAVKCAFVVKSKTSLVPRFQY